MTNSFERYHCQMALPGFGKSSQQLLQNARILIVGAGGLGCPVAQYLTASGIGTIGIADDDTVSVSNLHRQILYTPDDIGLPKAAVAAHKLQQQNPAVRFIVHHLRVTPFNVMDLIKDFDLIIEGTDNFETKYLLNDACVLQGKPLIYGAIYQYEGQVSVWNVRQQDGSYTPNYRDVFPDAEKAAIPNCSDGGVIPTLAGIVGCMQANEAIKYFTTKENVLSSQLWMVNVQTGSTHIVKLPKQSGVTITALPQNITNIISIDDLQQGDYELIDVRTQAEHQAFNIGGKNIPLDELENKLKLLSFSRPIVCYCASGKRSTAAVALIQQHFPEAMVFSLSNGIAPQ